MFNQVVLLGRLTRDPDIRSTAGAEPTTIARYTLAVDRRKKDEADFISCVGFGKSAEFAEKYLRKGTKILVSGRLQTGSYTDKDGRKVYTTDVIVESQEFCESRAAEGAGVAPAPAPAKTEDWTNIPDNITEDELPFGG